MSQSPVSAASLVKRRVQDGELPLVTNEDGMEQRCGNESIGIDFGAAGDRDHGQVHRRVVSKSQRSNGSCRCGRGDPLIEVAGAHRFRLSCAWTEAVPEEGGTVCAGVEEQKYWGVTEFRNTTGDYQAIVSRLPMEHSVELKREVFADDRLRHGSQRRLETDTLVTIVDQQVEVPQEVLAQHAAHFAGDGCRMIGAEDVSTGNCGSGDGKRVRMDDRHPGGSKHADDGLFSRPWKTELVSQLLVDHGFRGTSVKQEVIRAGAIYADRYDDHGEVVQLDLRGHNPASGFGLILRLGHRGYENRQD